MTEASEVGPSSVITQIGCDSLYGDQIGQPALHVRMRHVHSLFFLPPLQHMGVASLACVSGCACKPSRLDATTPHLLSLFMPYVFEVRDVSFLHHSVLL